MKNKLLILTSVALFGSFAHPVKAQNDDGKAADPEQQEWIVAFNNLPEPKREAFAEGFRDASRMFSQKRVFEALRRLEEVEEIFPDHPQLSNLKGACFVEFRSFQQAQDLFKRALELSPGNLSVRFNVAEVDFVRGQWQPALDKLTEIVAEMDNPSGSSALLCKFKMFICATKLGDEEKANKLAGIYDEEDDNPYFYCVKAIQAFEADDKQAAQKWLGAANNVYSRHEAKARDLTSFKDAMIESGYLESFYGGGDEGEE